MKTRFLLGVVVVVGLCLTLPFPSQRVLSFFSEVVRPVYAQGSADTKFWVFDGHLHPWASGYRRGGNWGDPDFSPQFTLPKAIEGGLGAAFFNTSADEFFEANHIAVKEILEQFDHLYGQIARYPDQIAVATNAAEVRWLRREGKIAAIVAIEGAMAIERNFGVLRMLHRLGLREMNLVHNMEHYTGDGMYSTKNNGLGSGLTTFGRELVAELNRLGILIDLSHMAEQTIWDSIAASTQPLVTTHSGVRALNNRPGNWSNDMIQALANKGGVICVCFLPQQVSPEYDGKWHGGQPRGSGIMRGVMDMESLVYREDPTTIYDFIRERTSGGEERRVRVSRERRPDMPPLSKLIDSIDHIVRLVGVDHVGISSDWGGYSVNIQGIENAGEYQNVAQALLQRGYSREDVAKIMGENVLRVFEEVTSTTQN